MKAIHSNRNGEMKMEKYLEISRMDKVKQPAGHWLALGTVAGQILFTLTWFVLGFVSPGFTIFGTVIKPYSAISTPISGLGLGPTAPFMNAAFVLSALLTLAGVVGIFINIHGMNTVTSWSCVALFALSPLGMAMDGIFTLESFMPHMLGFLLGIGSLVISFFVAGLLLRRISNWQRFGSALLLASPLTLVLMVLSLATFNQNAVAAGLGVAGLTERILCLEVGAWLVAFGWLAFRRA
jgi:hypothetical protein